MILPILVRTNYPLMRKILFTLLALAGLQLYSIAQEIKLSDNKFKIDKKTIAQVNKKKQGFLKEPDFDLVDASEKLLIHCEVRQFKPPIYPLDKQDDMGWYVFQIPELSDSIQMRVKSLYGEVNVPLFGAKDETFAKFYYKLNLVNADGSLNRQALDQFRTQYPENLSEYFRKIGEAQELCLKGIKTRVSRDTASGVIVKETKRAEIDPGKISVIEYEIYQGGVLLGKVEAKGHPKVVADESAEYDYSPGIMNLGKDYGVINYQFTNSNGCLMAIYLTEERQLFTYKDGIKTSKGIVLNKSQPSKRFEFIGAIASYLVRARYL